MGHQNVRDWAAKTKLIKRIKKNLMLLILMIRKLKSEFKTKLSKYHKKYEEIHL